MDKHGELAVLAREVLQAAQDAGQHTIDHDALYAGLKTDGRRERHKLFMLAREMAIHFGFERSDIPKKRRIETVPLGVTQIQKIVEEEEEEEEIVEEEEEKIVEEEEEEEEEEVGPAETGKRCKGDGTLSVCLNMGVPGNYGFCALHRKQGRKSGSTMTVNGKIWDALPDSMSTRSKWQNFLGNAQARNKIVQITQRRWMLLVVSPCAYCGRRGADILVGVDRVRNDTHYTDANSVPCCYSCNGEKNDMPLRTWMDRKGRLRSESEGAYVASLLDVIVE